MAERKIVPSGIAIPVSACAPEMAASDYIDLVLRNIGAESESTTIRTTLAQLQLAANSYVAPDTREAARAKVADGLWELLQTATPGSDLQLQLATAFGGSRGKRARRDTRRQSRVPKVDRRGTSAVACFWGLRPKPPAGGRM